MSLANYWDWLVAVRCSFPPEIRPFPDSCFTSQEHPRYPSAWSPRSRPESRSSVVVYTTPTREASTFPRHLHHVTPISLPFSAPSAYFPSPRGVHLFIPPDDRLSDLPAYQLICLHRLGASLSSLCALSCVRFLYFQWLAASFPKTPGVGVSRMQLARLRTRRCR